ncbi:hypothetical protein ZWY2020_003989 [Hordeum vulgare]|nr:hypothetical protein ZWY2020_003989 [Hordeum vulgare]
MHRQAVAGFNREIRRIIGEIALHIPVAIDVITQAYSYALDFRLLAANSVQGNLSYHLVKIGSNMFSDTFFCRESCTRPLARPNFIKSFLLCGDCDDWVVIMIHKRISTMMNWEGEVDTSDMFYADNDGGSGLRFRWMGWRIA